jgi:hypothetical protein
MVHTIQNLGTSNLNPGFEIQQLLGFLKHVIDIIIWIRDTGCCIYGRSKPKGILSPT